MSALENVNRIYFRRDDTNPHTGVGSPENPRRIVTGDDGDNDRDAFVAFAEGVADHFESIFGSAYEIASPFVPAMTIRDTVAYGGIHSQGDERDWTFGDTTVSRTTRIFYGQYAEAELGENVFTEDEQEAPEGQGPKHPGYELTAEGRAKMETWVTGMMAWFANVELADGEPGVIDLEHFQGSWAGQIVYSPGNVTVVADFTNYVVANLPWVAALSSEERDVVIPRLFDAACRRFWQRLRDAFKAVYPNSPFVKYVTMQGVPYHTTIAPTRRAEFLDIALKSERAYHNLFDEVSGSFYHHQVPVDGTPGHREVTWAQWNAFYEHTIGLVADLATALNKPATGYICRLRFNRDEDPPGPGNRLEVPVIEQQRVIDLMHSQGIDVAYVWDALINDHEWNPEGGKFTATEQRDRHNAYWTRVFEPIFIRAAAEPEVGGA